MSSWRVIVMAAQLFPTLQLNFVERGQSEGQSEEMPPSTLAPGDTVTIELTDTVKSGSILSASESEAVIEVDGNRWRITPKNAEDTAHFFSAGSMRPQTWFVRQRA